MVGVRVVVATGMATEMGRIADIIAKTADDRTPLQVRLAGLSRILSVGVLAVCVFIFIFSVLQNGGFSGGHVFEMFMIAVSLAVAAIPEGLVAVVTVVLSVGVTRMSQRNAIIRRLTAVETLGCTQIICSDKTGTLTQNRMTVVESYGEPTSCLWPWLCAMMCRYRNKVRCWGSQPSALWSIMPSAITITSMCWIRRCPGGAKLLLIRP